ncbi:MAG: hypothetical protein JNJ54_15460 [Myxococcaceae bacterium]|nr:hypothetical protein [Myxococcaceae bacterium]
MLSLPLIVLVAPGQTGVTEPASSVPDAGEAVRAPEPPPPAEQPRTTALTPSASDEPLALEDTGRARRGAESVLRRAWGAEKPDEALALNLALAMAKQNKPAEARRFVAVARRSKRADVRTQAERLARTLH